MNSSKEKDFMVQVESHKGILHKVARMYMDNLEDREDLQQEIIIQLWQSYAKFKGESAFSTWMYRVAINTAITYFKKDKRRNDRFSSEKVREPASENYDPLKDRQLEVFYLAVQQLNQVEKALIFYFMEGLSHRDIGLQLGISEANARVKLTRTKDQLQNIIKKLNYEL